MIKYLTRNKIDIEKYDTCIENSINSRIYAYSWYLDCVADNWDALILNDYKAVMPLPKRKKYSLNYIYLPPWVQQLGVFSDKEISKDLIKDFINEIPKKFVLVDYFFNSGNWFSHKNVKVRDNYVLKLNTDYVLLRKNYSKSRKWRINQAKKLNLIIDESNNLKSIISLFKSNKGKELGETKFDFTKLYSLNNNFKVKRNIKIFEVRNENNDLLGGAIFLIDKNRITYLFSAINKEGREKQVISCLTDKMIEENSNSNLIFDFEGSMIPEIASFFRSFGAVKEEYYHLSQKRLSPFFILN